MSIHDSTETFRRKVKPVVEEVVDHHVSESHTRHIKRMDELDQAMDALKSLCVGTFPPDASKPSMWQSLQEILLWKRGVNKVLWFLCASTIGVLITTIWKTVLNSGNVQ